MTDSLARKANAITDLAHTAWSKERDAGFPTLSRIPSSTVKRFLTFYATLGQEDAVRWSNFTLSRIPLMFLEKWQPTSSPEDAAWFKECLDASFAHFWGWDTWGLRELKNAVSLSESAKAGPLDISWIPLDRYQVAFDPWRVRKYSAESEAICRLAENKALLRLKLCGYFFRVNGPIL